MVSSGTGDNATAAGKRRRSLFAALFSGNLASSTSATASDEPTKLRTRSNSRHELQVNTDTGERRLSLGARPQGATGGFQAKSRAARLAAESDIVLVAPSEAKCAEAQIVGCWTSESARGCKQAGAQCDSAPTNQETAAKTRVSGGALGVQAPASVATGDSASVMRRLFNKMTRRSAPSGAEPELSYQDQLNQQLELEKMRFLRRPVKHKRNSSSLAMLSGGASCAPNAVSKSSSSLSSSSAASSPSSSTSSAVLETFSREQSPLNRAAWHTNEYYIPKMGGISETNCAPPAAKLGAAQANGEACARNRWRRASPLVEQFLASHRLRFDSLSSVASSATMNHDDDDHEASSSGNSSSYNSFSCNSATARATKATVAAAGQLGSQQQPSMPFALEAERRLKYWQSLAEEAKAHRRPELESSDDSFEFNDDGRSRLADSSSPALVCYCSDDTSCSSVELVWSRPQLVERRRNYRRQQELQRNLDSTRVRPVVRLTPSPLRTSGAVQALSPTHLQRPADTAVQQQQQQRASMKRLIASVSERGQHAAVLELAKPSRARGRRVASGADDYVRWRSREQRRERTRKRQLELAQPQAIKRHSQVAEITEEAPVEPLSRPSSGQNDWVQNPIFGNERATQQDHRLALRRASCADLAVQQAASGGESQAQKVDLTAKLNRCKELLRRLGSTSNEASLGTAGQKQNDEANQRGATFKDEQLDRFNSNELLDGGTSESVAGKLNRCHHRWSLRVGSPFRRHTDSNGAYLNQLMNLDKKIKSNVSSLKSQLGDKLQDTSKRASVLADQLITSISKDTTKEQIGPPIATGLKQQNTLTSSFSIISASNATDSQTDFDAPSSRSSADKAKMFSLIYMHQQQAGGGQPIIIKQPKSILSQIPVGQLEVAQVAPERKSAQLNADEQDVVKLSTVRIESQTRAVGRQFESHCKTIATGETGRELDSREVISSPLRPARKIKRLKSRKLRRQANVPLFIDDSDEDELKGVANPKDLQYFRCESNDPRNNVTY